MRFTALLRVVMTMVVLVTVFRTSDRYFYCEAMGLSLHDPCAASERCDRSVAVVPAHEDCCKLVVLSTLPRAMTATVLSVPPSPVTAWIPVVLANTTRQRSHPVDRTAARGPPRPSQRQAELMVFLT